jgi:hypothetical protein
MRRDRILKCFAGALTLCSFWIGLAASAEPPGGPAVARGANDRGKVAADPAEDERGRALNEAIEARDQADLSRAAYELNHKAGKVTGDAKDAFDQVLSAYARSIDRPLVSPEVIKVVAYCHLRLAGAYQYVGEFDKAVAQGKEAAKVSAGSSQEIDATLTVGLIYLQALHDPRKALTWMKRAQDLAQSISSDKDEQAKWLAAAAQGIQRCEQEAGKK